MNDERSKRGDKVSAYKWVCVDKPGSLLSIDKQVLKIDDSYQRDLNHAKTLELASQWSWVACGALIVALRGNDFWVVDGQHRLAAALKRSDISELPCIVFETTGVKEEAIGFLRSNTNRRPIGAIARHRAAIASDDALAKLVQAEITAAGLEVASCAHRAPQIKCITMCTTFARQNFPAFREALHMSASISVAAGAMVSERLLSGLFYIATTIPGGFGDKRLQRRLMDVGLQRLLDGAARAAAFYVRGGPKVFADGMMQEINKGLRDRFEIPASASPK